MIWPWSGQSSSPQLGRVESHLALTITGVSNSGNSRNQIGHFQTHSETVVHGDQHIHQSDIDILQRLPRASQAAFNASSNDNEALCLKDTRVAVLKEIKAWAYDKDERCIFWVNGVAGTGKSTIARTICDDFHKNGHLAASFFFSRSEKDRSSAQKFFSTIAWQVAHCGVPSVGEAIISALHKRPDIADLSLKEQWKCLVLQPLQQLKSGIFVIVIDALDECEDEKSVKLLVSLLLQAASVKHCRLRIVVTSRPEAALRKSFPKSAVFYRPLELHKEPGFVADLCFCAGVCAIEQRDQTALRARDAEVDSSVAKGSSRMGL